MSERLSFGRMGTVDLGTSDSPYTPPAGFYLYALEADAASATFGATSTLGSPAENLPERTRSEGVRKVGIWKQVTISSGNVTGYLERIGT